MASNDTPDRPKPTKLPLISEKILSRIADSVPEFLKDPFRTNQRKLQAVERRIQRKFLSEYRMQVKSLEPVLRERGAFIGRSIIDAFIGHHTADTKYEDAAAQKSGEVFDQTNIKELMVTLDPIIAPVLTPFVEGLKTPINEELGSVQSQVVKIFIGTAAASLVTGFVIGRATAGGGGSGSSKGK